MANEASLKDIVLVVGTFFGISMLIATILWFIITPGFVEVSVEITKFGVRVENGVLVDLVNETVVAGEDEWVKIDQGDLARYGVMVKVGDRHMIVPLETFKEKSTLSVTEDGRILHSSTAERFLKFTIPVAAILTPVTIFVASLLVGDD